MTENLDCNWDCRICFISMILVFVSKYRTVGPDEALIVTGSYLGYEKCTYG